MQVQNKIPHYSRYSERILRKNTFYYWHCWPFFMWPLVEWNGWPVTVEGREILLEWDTVRENPFQTALCWLFLGVSSTASLISHPTSSSRLCNCLRFGVGGYAKEVGGNYSWDSSGQLEKRWFFSKTKLHLVLSYNSCTWAHSNLFCFLFLFVFYLSHKVYLLFLHLIPVSF